MQPIATNRLAVARQSYSARNTLAAARPRLDVFSGQRLDRRDIGVLWYTRCDGKCECGVFLSRDITAGVQRRMASVRKIGSTLLGNLPKTFTEQLAKQLKGLVRSIREHNELETELAAVKKLCSGEESQGKDTLANRSASMIEFKVTPEKSPIHPPSSSILERLIGAEKAAEELRNKLTNLVQDYMNEDRTSSISSLALDVSKISLLKASEPSKSQFASSPNLSSSATVKENLSKSKLKRFESASTSNLPSKKITPKSEGGMKLSKLRRLSPSCFFSKKESASSHTHATSQNENKGSKANTPSSLKANIIKPIRTGTKQRNYSEPSQFNVPIINVSKLQGAKYIVEHGPIFASFQNFNAEKSKINTLPTLSEHANLSLSSSKDAVEKRILWLSPLGFLIV
ncbi:hypothetical protein EVAR_51804_1 [Eumeta japonica]|uniref:Uncharacterized protein n=1 Tax=Eumeta variegata TaxID=151549 RepID=A0A4C1XZQ6_EUMVA|nr:hypothetical protein EVAR_51804_1 [Eumeta japonica]